MIHFNDYSNTQYNKTVTYCQQNCMMQNDLMILNYSLDIVFCSLDLWCFWRCFWSERAVDSESIQIDDKVAVVHTDMKTDDWKGVFTCSFDSLAVQ